MSLPEAWLVEWRQKEEARLASRQARRQARENHCVEVARRKQEREHRRAEDARRKQERAAWHAEVARRREEYRRAVEARRLERLATAPARAAAAVARKNARRKARYAAEAAIRRAERAARTAARQAAYKLERQRIAQERAAARAVPLKVRRRQAWLAMLKGLKCSRCPESDPRTFEFHHPGEKVAGVPDLVARGASMKRVREEIARCELLCANCHRKHHGRPERSTRHDDRRRYNEWWDEIRAGLQCARCGESDSITFEYCPPIRPLLRRLVARDRVLKALETTVVLCANCRRKNA